MSAVASSRGRRRSRRPRTPGARGSGRAVPAAACAADRVHRGLDDAQRTGREAALEASGLLDAWVTPEGTLLDPATQDVLLTAMPSLSARAGTAAAGESLSSVRAKEKYEDQHER